MTKFRRRLQWSEWLTKAVVVFLLLDLGVFASAQDLASDTAALIELKKAVDINNTLSNWVTLRSVCNWTGVTCGNVSGNQRVWKLKVPGSNLAGTIPPGTIGNLDQLRAISMHSNRLNGSLPADMSKLGLVQNLWIHENQLSGPLPSNFTLWPRMVTLSLHTNNFTGGIPASIAELNLVQSVLLQNNQLSGVLRNISTSTLTDFNVANNNFTGPIPASLARFNSSAFKGNPGLCGSPLVGVNCPPPPVVSPPSPTPSVPPVASTPVKKKSAITTGIIIAIVLGDVAVILLITACVTFLCYRRKKARGAPGAKVDPSGEVEEVKHESSSGELCIFVRAGKNYAFDYTDLLRASAEVLGRGSVGTSYKAVLEDGTTVTVKRLKDVTPTKKEFETQVQKAGALQHRNLVPLRAYYFSKDEKLLVCDYMPGGSLSALLHGTKGGSRTPPLDWVSRVRIAIGAARGVAFLHNEHSFTHGNIKSSNVLITRELKGCVSDYGLAQLLNPIGAASRILDEYKAPEVIATGKVTLQADIYSFGVLLLELLTGKAPTQATVSDEGIYLPRWVQSAVREERTAEVYDLELMKFQNIFPNIEEAMVRMLQIALQCVAQEPGQRPRMDEVLKSLKDVRKFSDSGNDNELFSTDTSRSGAYETSVENSKEDQDVHSLAEIISIPYIDGNVD